MYRSGLFDLVTVLLLVGREHLPLSVVGEPITVPVIEYRVGMSALHCERYLARTRVKFHKEKPRETGQQCTPTCA